MGRNFPSEAIRIGIGVPLDDGWHHNGTLPEWAYGGFFPYYSDGEESIAQPMPYGHFRALASSEVKPWMLKVASPKGEGPR
jgi:hypothetical protein